jgi:uncharacterized protein YjbI with pentapeptide repeats
MVEPRPKMSLALDKHGVARQLLRSLNETSQSARKGWLFFLALTAFLFVAVSSVTHTDLLLNTPLKLPIIQIELNLRGFFLFAPILFILVHFGVLLHHATLARKAEGLNNLLRTEERGKSRTHRVRMEVSSYFYSQNVAGPERGMLLGALLRAMGWLTLDLLPLWLVLYFQVTFLPVHDPNVTFVHRIFLACDIGVLGCVGIARRFPEMGLWQGLIHLIKGHGRSFSLGLGTSAVVLFLSICVATLPSAFGDDQENSSDLDRLMTSIWPTRVPFDWNNQTCRNWEGDRCAFWLTAAVFEQPIDFVSGRAGLLSRNFVLTDKETLSSPRETKDEDARISLRGRDLRYATFDRSNLQGVDFVAADLSGSSMKSSDLNDATFGCAIKGKKTVIYQNAAKQMELRSSDVEDCTDLRGADLSQAKLTNSCVSCLSRSKLDGIVLRKADLRGFDFKQVSLPRADLSEAILQGTDFSDGFLDGAILSGVEAQGAIFKDTSLQGAILFGAQLDGADFRGANLSGADLTAASLFGADLSTAFLFGANLRRANVWQTTPSSLIAFSLARTKQLQLEPPAGEHLTLIGKIIAQLKEAGREETPLLSSLLNLIDREAWKRAAPHQTWLSLAGNVVQEDEKSLDQNVGRYIGDLACGNLNVFRTMLKAYGTVSGTDIEDGFFGQPLPPGVTEADLRRIRPTYGAGYTYFSAYPNRESAEYLAAFNARVVESDCTMAKSIAPAMLQRLREAAEDASMHASTPETSP